MFREFRLKDFGQGEEFMSLKNVTESEDGESNVTVKNTAVENTIKDLGIIKRDLYRKHTTNIQAVTKMSSMWRSEDIGRSASAFFYANLTLIAFSKYCIDTVEKAKETMKDFSDKMDLIDQDLAAMNFLAVSGSTEDGE